MSHTTEYRRILHKMGYYNYQSGLIYRHLNQEGGWDEHLERCRTFILKALDYYSPAKISVLGSGWLMELPLAETVERDIRVTLIDIVHPPEVIAQAGQLKNVELVEADVSGGLISEVWLKTSKYSFLKKMKTLEDISVPEYVPESDPGMVISLNILTQLESLPVDFLKKRSNVQEEEYLLFRKKIQDRHMEFLKKHQSVLISDVAEISTDRSGNSDTVQTMVSDIPDSILREEWTWNFDSKSTDFYNSTSVMKVLAIVI
ncbi:MAG: hypothetical protein IPH69_02620 [Bacteroidales bacterium]|nr:hypothetical protein [Bacteroidales bacterium]